MLIFLRFYWIVPSSRVTKLGSVICGVKFRWKCRKISFTFKVEFLINKLDRLIIALNFAPTTSHAKTLPNPWKGGARIKRVLQENTKFLHFSALGGRNHQPEINLLQLGFLALYIQQRSNIQNNSVVFTVKKNKKKWAKPWLHCVFF